MALRLFLVVEASDDDELHRSTLGMFKTSEVSKVDNGVRASFPVEVEFASKFLKFSVDQMIFNDGPSCHVCGRPNQVLREHPG